MYYDALREKNPRFGPRENADHGASSQDDPFGIVPRKQLLQVGGKWYKGQYNI
jgi:hypothetical protein